MAERPKKNFVLIDDNNEDTNGNGVLDQGEDTNGDGRAEKTTVFADGQLIPTGFAPDDGG